MVIFEDIINHYCEMYVLFFKDAGINATNWDMYDTYEIVAAREAAGQSLLVISLVCVTF